MALSRAKPSNAISAGLGGRPRLPRGEYAEHVLGVVRQIPRGRVMTYGDVAEHLGSGAARAVGNAMHHIGPDTHWWRVVQASGAPAAAHPAEALERLHAEGTPMRVGGERVDLAAARWDGR